MASSKSASVKLGLNPSAFLKGLKDIDKAAEKTAKHLESVFDRALSKLEKDLTEAAKKAEKAFKSAKISINGKGLINGINAAETKATSSAQRIGKAYQRALSGAAGGAGDSAKKLERAIKELERAEKRLAQAREKASGAKSAREGVELKQKREGEIRAIKDKKGARADMLGNAGAIAGGAVAGLGILAGAVGGVLNSDSLKGANTVYDKANRISIGARGAGEESVDPKLLTAEFYAITEEIRGTTADALADAVGQFVSMTGDLKTARSSLKDFATVAAATGSDVSDVASTAAAISQQFGITDPEQIKDVLASLTFQGKAGAFELADAANLFPRLAAAGSSFGLDKSASGVKTLGGITQIARTATGSGEQAATAVESMLTQLKVKSDDLKAQGVKVYDKGKVRDLPSILVDAISKVGGSDVERKNAGLSKILGEQGIRAVNPLIAQFNEVFRNTKGTDAQKRAAAEAAITQRLQESINATGAWDEVQRDAQQAQKSASAALTSAEEKFKQVMSSTLVPRLVEMAEKLAASPEAIDKLASALELVGDLILGIGEMAVSLGLVKGKSAELIAKERVARDTRKDARGLDEKLRGMQMTPEQIKDLEKKDPAELARRRAEAQDLMIKRDAANQVAGKLEEEARLGNETFKGRAAKGVADRFANVASPLANTVKIDNTVAVKVVNANEIKGNQTPTPGFVPR